MTIGYKDKCPNCKKTLTETTNEIDEEHIMQPFVCPYCRATLAFKKHYSWLLVATIGSWVISTILKYGIAFYSKTSPYVEIFAFISSMSLISMFFVAWLQHIKVIKKEN